MPGFQVASVQEFDSRSGLPFGNKVHEPVRHAHHAKKLPKIRNRLYRKPRLPNRHPMRRNEKILSQSAWPAEAAIARTDAQNEIARNALVERNAHAKKDATVKRGATAEMNHAGKNHLVRRLHANARAML
jgi:hypothetical protein